MMSSRLKYKEHLFNIHNIVFEHAVIQFGVFNLKNILIFSTFLSLYFPHLLWLLPPPLFCHCKFIYCIDYIVLHTIPTFMRCAIRTVDSVIIFYFMFIHFLVASIFFMFVWQKLWSRWQSNTTNTQSKRQWKIMMKNTKKKWNEKLQNSHSYNATHNSVNTEIKWRYCNVEQADGNFFVHAVDAK